MKKQSGPFKLKYKKSAFPFMENFHVKKHGKLKIERKKSAKDQIYDIKNPIETEPEKTKIKKTVTRGILDLPKRQPGNGIKRGKISSPPPKKPVNIDAVKAIGDAAKKVKPKKFSDFFKPFSDKVSKISDKASKGGGFKDSPFNPYRRKGLRRFF